MGGSGSGTWYRWNRKRVTKDLRSVDIRSDFRNSSLHGIIGFDDEDEKKFFCWEQNFGVVNQIVSLTWTPCNYGGKRPWFLCPECGRRVAVLYAQGRSLSCRRCCNLNYPCQRQDEANRLLSKVQKIRGRLGADTDCSAPIPEKPRGMHRKTFIRLASQAEETNNRVLMSIAGSLGILGQVVDLLEDEGF